MVLTEFWMLAITFVISFVFIGIILYFMEADKALNIKRRITKKIIWGAAALSLIIVWLSWLIIHGLALATNQEAPINYQIF